jgi:hypothetical protein
MNDCVILYFAPNAVMTYEEDGMSGTSNTQGEKREMGTELLSQILKG